MKEKISFKKTCNKNKPLTKKEESNYNKETNWHICKKGFINYEDD